MTVYPPNAYRDRLAVPKRKPRTTPTRASNSIRIVTDRRVTHAGYVETVTNG